MQLAIRKTTLISILYVFCFLFLINWQQKLFYTLTGFETSLTIFLTFGFVFFAILVNLNFLVDVFILGLVRGSAFSYICISIIAILTISSLTVQNTPFFGGLVSFFFTISACNMLKKITSIGSLLIPLFFYLGFIVLQLFQNDFDPRYVFINSQNWISFYGILLFAPYAYKCFTNIQKVNLISSILLGLLSIYSRSRSGIIGATIVFLATFMINRNFLLGFLILLFMIPLSIYLVFVSDFDKYTDRFSSISNFLLDGNGRETILSGYLDSLNWYNYFVGIDMSDIKTDLYITSNLHSSYLNASTGIGLFGVVLLCIIFTESLLFFLRHNAGIALIWLAVLLRIATDTGALFNFFDVAVFYPLYLRFCNPNYIQRKKGEEIS